ncbi:MAG TPA: TIGR00730 family Rossman fold protein, partial [Candidatus Hydrogenedentes bacterium]|nr:TIGR00730 family Rossman fold protein [Candidatus Hydrogenedentota bacterium]
MWKPLAYLLERNERNTNLQSICVYAASSDALDDNYKDAAQRLGALIARHGHTLVYGGGCVGLMGVCARAVHARGGGRVVGVITDKLVDLELAYRKADELIVTGAMSERKRIMAERADAFIALPGGFGTIEEVMEILVLKQLWYHQKPCVFLNVDGIYDHLFAFFDALIEARFIKDLHKRLYRVCSSPEEAYE